MINKGVSRLANAIHGRIKSTEKANGSLVVDTGTIQSDMSLVTDSYPMQVPQGDYYASQMLTFGEKDEKLSETENGEVVKIPEKLRWLKPGDRVVVAWINHDPFVLMRFNPGHDAGS